MEVPRGCGLEVEVPRGCGPREHVGLCFTCSEDLYTCTHVYSPTHVHAHGTHTVQHTVHMYTYTHTVRHTCSHACTHNTT